MKLRMKTRVVGAPLALLIALVCPMAMATPIIVNISATQHGENTGGLKGNETRLMRNHKTHGDVRAQIESANAKFEAAFKRGSAASIADLYTKDAELFPANSNVVRGKTAIRAFWQHVIDMGIKGARLKTTELKVHGDIAIEIGHYQLFAGNNVVADQGKYLVVWKHADGQWKLHRDIWTTSQPAAAPAG